MGENAGVSMPRWDDPTLKAGTMVRGALWLVEEVGESGIFTKEQVRQAFPGIAQADRRIRDLRDYGWVIHTNTDDITLRPGEQRFVRAGLPVWDEAARGQVASKTVSAKQRKAVFAADDYQCTVCGISGGEPYPDNPTQTAVLSITRRSIEIPGESTRDQLVTECKRCRAGTGQAQPVDPRRLLMEIRGLDQVDQDRLARWIRRGRRGPTPLDRLWTAFRHLPLESREQVARELGIG